MKKLWIRIGAEIELPDDFNVSEDSIGELEDIIDQKVTNRQFKICGETYAPCFEHDEYVNHLITGSEPEVNFIFEEAN